MWRLSAATSDKSRIDHGIIIGSSPNFHHPSGEQLMDHHTSGQIAQPSHSSSFQWLSFAYQNLTEIPYDAILTQTDTLEVLDLSYNLLNEYPSLTFKSSLNDQQHYFGLFKNVLKSSCSGACCPSFNPYWNPVLLGQMERLSTLILDCNKYTSHVKFPYMPSVTTICVNKNKINNLPVFVEEIRRKFPNIKILSMMNNEAAPSYFNGGSLTQYKDYRLYVISQIPGLEILDDTEVLERERAQARKTYRLQQSRHVSRKKKEEPSRKHKQTHAQKQ
ncbi:uncharacterized protein ACBR49_019031 [Aulostomus maculatus]